MCPETHNHDKYNMCQQAVVENDHLVASWQSP